MDHLWPTPNLCPLSCPVTAAVAPHTHILLCLISVHIIATAAAVDRTGCMRQGQTEETQGFLAKTQACDKTGPDVTVTACISSE